MNLEMIRLVLMRKVHLMTNFYRFPEIKNPPVKKMDQLMKIDEELEESVMAFAFEKRIDYGMELMDIIHAAETALRTEFSDDEIDVIYETVIEKNKERNYYV